METTNVRPIKVLSIFGTRPEAIKMAPVVQALEADQQIESLVCVTAQHREMLDQVLNLFEITPDIDLNLMKPGQSLSELTARVFTHLDPVLKDLKPDWILVQGDTTTVMSAALCAFYNQVKVGHVEAGLRTGDKWQPFPEEVNRKVAGVIADLHFAPTAYSKQNLLKENIPSENVIITGNTVIDALHQIAARSYEFSKGPLAQIPFDKRIVTITAHRRENFGQPIEEICQAILELAKTYSDVQFVYPVHLNPRVQEPVHRLLGGIDNISLLEPLEYLPMVQLLKRSELLLTDSGGLQEEAPGVGVPVLVLREVTERPEGVEAGTVRLVGTDRMKIVQEAKKLLDDKAAYEQMAKAVNPYGDGKAAQRIVEAVKAYQDR
jgi:UDP-N-acetylglucosamine 2-epimerase (non-hydrolysing)